MLLPSSQPIFSHFYINTLCQATTKLALAAITKMQTKNKQGPKWLEENITCAVHSVAALAGLSTIWNPFRQQNSVRSRALRIITAKRMHLLKCACLGIALKTILAIFVLTNVHYPWLLRSFLPHRMAFTGIYVLSSYTLATVPGGISCSPPFNRCLHISPSSVFPECHLISNLGLCVIWEDYGEFPPVLCSSLSLNHNTTLLWNAS